MMVKIQEVFRHFFLVQPKMFDDLIIDHQEVLFPIIPPNIRQSFIIAGYNLFSVVPAYCPLEYLRN